MNKNKVAMIIAGGSGMGADSAKVGKNRCTC